MTKQNPGSGFERELKIVRRLLALSLIDGKKNREQIALLAAAGMDRHEIAELVGTTAGTVSVEISNLKKRKSGGTGTLRNRSHRRQASEDDGFGARSDTTE